MLYSFCLFAKHGKNPKPNITEMIILSKEDITI